MIATTVAGTVTYDWPEDYLLTISLSLAGGKPLEPADPDSVRQFAQGGLTLQVAGVWYEVPDSEGTRKLGLYPPPGDGLSIELEWVYRPTSLVNDTDEPSWLPEDFHPALLPEVAADYYEHIEDNPELAQRNSEKADQWVLDLLHYDTERGSGSGVFLPAISGWTAPV